ncbi:hypothetical protein [Marmoricola sp. RAF53]|uniref:hypothetical protein n=1 Tax=Marmoricola sp. RAF53 TaxID=3233059 RepID=UPI003F9E8433
MWTRRLLPVAAVFVLAGALVAGCGDESSPLRAGPSAASSAASSSAAPSGMPTAVPAADGLVRTIGTATVFAGAGKDPELCLGGIGLSYPSPPCGGVALTGFDWADHRGTFAQANGVRWGGYAVTGRFDGTRFAVTEVVPFASYDGPPPQDDTRDLSSPCPVPEGGWKVVDPATTTEETESAFFERAGTLPGYADAWIDRALLDDPAGTGPEAAVDDPRRMILNVRVTRDLAGAERTLRAIWGGPMCVSRAEHTDAELRRIADALDRVPGMLSVSSGFDAVEVYVVHDDGTLQAWADRRFGPGLVEVSSALAPVKG